MLEYSEVKPGKIIIYEDDPCEVLDSHVARTQQRKPQNQTKLRSLISGKAYNATFHVTDKIDEADITKREIKFLYSKAGRPPEDGQEYWFCDPTDPSNRFKLDEKLMESSKKFLKPNEIATGLVFTNDDDEEQIISVKLPIKMTFTIKEAPPSIKGNTANGGGKLVVLENGTSISAPFFVNTGDKIVVNTETGEYVERA